VSEFAAKRRDLEELAAELAEHFEYVETNGGQVIVWLRHARWDALRIEIESWGRKELNFGLQRVPDLYFMRLIGRAEQQSHLLAGCALLSRSSSEDKAIALNSFVARHCPKKDLPNEVTPC